MLDGASTSSSPRRLIKPRPRFWPVKEELEEEESRLLSKIEAFCRCACARLAVEASPVTLARFLDAGVFVGLLDPVSNVMVNTLVTSDLRPDLIHKVFDETKLEEMGKRSFDGLIAFLIYFFPYLAEWEAVRYLIVADADLLVAVRLIVADRGMMGFSVISLASLPAFLAALRVAAQVAKHPEPQRLVTVWMSLSSQLQQLLCFLSAIHAQTLEMNLVRIQRLLARRPRSDDLGKAWDLAASRPPYNNIANMPYQTTRSLRMVCLDTIRSFYLQALARLPRKELQTRYHRSMLKAGYCYGPMDPVSNIIINTIWYDAMFTAADYPVFDMIGPNSLTRLESRSFYGLASFLQTRYHNLSEHEVVQCLVASSAYLFLADPNLDATAGHAYLPFADPNLSAAAREAERRQQQCRTDTPGLYDAVRKVEQQSPCSSPKEAYAAAATAAWHPDPEAHAVFLSSAMAMLQGPAFLLLQSGDRLTSEDVRLITSCLLLSCDQKPTPEPLKKKNPDPVIIGKVRSEAQQRRISAKVKTALDKHLVSDEESMYDLHIICGANEYVGAHEYCPEVDTDVLSFGPFKYPYSHVNFLVTLKDSPSDADTYPLLYFAEFDNEEGEPLLICPVDVPTPFTEHVRCVYCEAEGTKIVHPASGKFHGTEVECEEVVCAEEGNEDLMCKNEYAVQHMCGLEEDFMYVDIRCIS